MESLQPWLDRYTYEVDDRFLDKILMPGLIDPHVHPSLPAVLTQFPFTSPSSAGVTTPSAPAICPGEGYPYIKFCFFALTALGSNYRKRRSIL